jgi:hypothetical protein
LADAQGFRSTVKTTVVGDCQERLQLIDIHRYRAFRDNPGLSL